MHTLFTSLGVSTVDSAGIGRINADDLPEQSLMELFVEDVRYKYRICSKDDSFLPIEEWPILEFHDNGSIDRINFGRVITEGAVRFAYLPRNVTNFTASSMELDQSLDTADLPLSLKHLIVFDNWIHGSFRIANLPENMQTIRIDGNFFKGSLQIEALPSSIIEFNASFNKFSGYLELKRLPSRLESIEFDHNNFCGSILMWNVPDSLQYISFANNSFHTDSACLEMHDKLIVSLDAEHKGRVYDKKGNVLESCMIDFSTSNDCLSIEGDQEMFM